MREKREWCLKMVHWKLVGLGDGVMKKAPRDVMTVSDPCDDETMPDTD